MNRAQDEREVMLTSIAKVSEWIGFSAGCMKDGRPWDGEATTLRDEAKAALAALGDPLRSQDEYRRGVEDAAMAARDALVDYEWPPQDGDAQIDNVVAAIRALATSGDSAGGVPALTKADDSGRQV